VAAWHQTLGGCVLCWLATADADGQAHPIIAPSYRFYPDSTKESAQMDAAMKTYGVRPVKLI